MTDTRILELTPRLESGKTEGHRRHVDERISSCDIKSRLNCCQTSYSHDTRRCLKNKVSNSQIVQVKVEGTRPLIFDDVVVRISPRFATYMHIDYDEANACEQPKELVAIFLSKRRKDNERF